MLPDLHNELDIAAAKLDGRVITHLAKLGVSFEAVLRCGYVGCDSIMKTGRLFMPAPNGHQAFIVPVWAGEPPSPECEDDSDPVLYDLVSFHPGNPRQWWYRLGSPNTVLGRHWLDRGEPVPLFTDILSWLRAGGVGVVPLDVIEDHESRRRRYFELKELATVIPPDSGRGEAS